MKYELKLQREKMESFDGSQVLRWDYIRLIGSDGDETSINLEDLAEALKPYLEVKDD